MSGSRSTVVHASAPRNAGHRVGHALRWAVSQAWARNLTRAGFVARGLIYLLPGVLALRLALGTHGAAITQTGAIGYIGAQPVGHVLLLGVAVGLAGYALWGVIRAWLDPGDDGRDISGILIRIGYATSSLAYLGLLAATIRFIAGSAEHGAATRDWTTTLLAQPFGPWLVGLVGVCWIVGGGLTQIWLGWSGRFADGFDRTRIGSAEAAWARRLGRIGIIARGLVFGIIGLFLIGAALHHDPEKAHGMDRALLELARQPFGPVLLAAVAFGLVMFGVYSILCVRWMRVRVPDHRSQSTRPSHTRGPQ